MSLINSESTLDEINETVLNLLNRAGNDPKSAYRYIVFNTISEDFPNTRYVVLRKFDKKELELYVYTDYRSGKVHEIEANPRVSILAYDKQKKLQLKLKTHAKLHYKDEVSNHHWNSIISGKESYNTKLNPGKPIESLTEGHKLKPEIDDKHFTVIILKLQLMEVLQLNKEGHIRAKFDFENSDQSFLVP
ncbi:pyridoxamine 5'-phosphate oxidase family protein [Marivirga arenosa]|uniref:Pyridoxamine 5'-phosphate oxidase family protein n=1 Tax=Marivirga arenosa TaxID=3059076 RepID=A0AA49JHJ2_9BACT|nr:pyridoxamine 5'-phosphate oxidase family protein [Marivirga sp. BKB1-2]WKK80756.2 pyridoxamine 5'-phosphate oxidase family protein [Marivirga sp. BKB1-2]